MKSLKKFEKIAPILVVILLIDAVLGQFLASRIIGFMGPKDFGIYQFQYSYVALVQTLVGSFIKIIVAIWLAMEAKKIGASQFVWALFGFFFGLTAAILFFVLQVLDELRFKPQR